MFNLGCYLRLSFLLLTLTINQEVLAQLPSHTNSLIPPPFPLTTLNVSGSQGSTSAVVSNSSSSLSGTPSASASAVLTTVLTTSTGPNGTATFTTTVTTIVTSGISNSVTSTTTSYPSLSTVSPCVSECLQTAVANENCSSVTDVACFCSTGTLFTSNFTSCVQVQCGGQLTSAEQLARQFCNIVSVSLSFPSVTSSAADSSSISGSSSSSASISIGSTSTSSATSAQLTSNSAISNYGAFENTILLVPIFLAGISTFFM